MFYDLTHVESLQIFWCVYKITQSLTYKIVNEIYEHVILEHSPLTQRKSIIYIHPLIGESLQIFWCVYKITQKLANKIIDKIYRYVNLEHALLTKRKTIMYTKHVSILSYESESHKCEIRSHVR